MVASCSLHQRRPLMAGHGGGEAAWQCQLIWGEDREARRGTTWTLMWIRRGQHVNEICLRRCHSSKIMMFFFLYQEVTYSVFTVAKGWLPSFVLEGWILNKCDSWGAQTEPERCSVDSGRCAFCPCPPDHPRSKRSFAIKKGFITWNQGIPFIKTKTDLFSLNSTE